MPVIICSKNKDSEIYDLINNTLAKRLNLHYMEDNSPVKNDKIHKNMLNFYFCNKTPVFEGNSGIIVLSNSFNFTSPLKNLTNNMLFIFDSSNTNVVKELYRKNVQAITCGTSNKDTISIASIDFPRVAVSLQRNIINLSGKIVEPRENILNINKEYDIFTISSLYAISLVLDINIWFLKHTIINKI